MTDRAVQACPFCGGSYDAPTTVCGGCAERARRDLADLPRLSARLLHLARTGTASAGEPISGSSDPSLPLGADLWSFAGQASPGTVQPATWADADCQTGDIPLPAALASWVLLVAEERRISVPMVQRRHYEAAIYVYVEWLERHHDWAMRQAWADEYAAELHHLWRRARTLSRDWPLVHHLPAPCPELDCGLLTLRRDDGASFVYCDHRDGGCGRRWTQTDYDRLVIVLREEVSGAPPRSRRREPLGPVCPTCHSYGVDPHGDLLCRCSTVLASEHAGQAS